MELDRGLVGGSTVLLLLSLLHRKDMYGYEIIRELELLSENVFSFKEGTLYPVLHRMENGNLVKSYQKEAENGKKRKYYAITPQGERRLAQERETWKVFSASVDRVIGGERHACV